MKLKFRSLEARIVFDGDDFSAEKEDHSCAQAASSIQEQEQTPPPISYSSTVVEQASQSNQTETIFPPQQEYSSPPILPLMLGTTELNPEQTWNTPPQIYVATTSPSLLPKSLIVVQENGQNEPIHALDKNQEEPNSAAAAEAEKRVLGKRKIEKSNGAVSTPPEKRTKSKINPRQTNQEEQSIACAFDNLDCRYTHAITMRKNTTENQEPLSLTIQMNLEYIYHQQSIFHIQSTGTYCLNNLIIQKSRSPKISLAHSYSHSTMIESNFGFVQFHVAYQNYQSTIPIIIRTNFFSYPEQNITITTQVIDSILEHSSDIILRNIKKTKPKYVEIFIETESIFRYSRDLHRNNRNEINYEITPHHIIENALSFHLLGFSFYITGIKNQADPTENETTLTQADQRDADRILTPHVHKKFDKIRKKNDKPSASLSAGIQNLTENETILTQADQRDADRILTPHVHKKFDKIRKKNDKPSASLSAGIQNLTENETILTQADQRDADRILTPHVHKKFDKIRKRNDEPSASLSAGIQNLTENETTLTQAEKQEPDKTEASNLRRLLQVDKKTIGKKKNKKESATKPQKQSHKDRTVSALSEFEEEYYYNKYVLYSYGNTKNTQFKTLRIENVFLSNALLQNIFGPNTIQSNLGPVSFYAIYQNYEYPIPIIMRTNYFSSCSLENRRIVTQAIDQTLSHASQIVLFHINKSKPKEIKIHMNAESIFSYSQELHQQHISRIDYEVIPQLCYKNRDFLDILTFYIRVTKIKKNF